MAPRTRSRGKGYRVVALCLTLALGVGAVDMLLPLGAAIAALYSVVMVASLLGDDPRMTGGTAIACVALIVAGGLISPASAVPLWIVLLNRSLFIVVVAITATLVMWHQRATRQIHAQQALLERANGDLSRQARIDTLTGLANRREFDERLARECHRANRANAPISLLMIDVDHFKSYNDSAGHLAGDECLKAVVGAIVAAMRRPVDLVARYGGEEFAVVLPMTSEEVAKERGEEACRAVRALNIVHPGLERGAIVTVSVGVAGGQLPVAPADLIRAADEMLYKAKSLGRNCVVARD